MLSERWVVKKKITGRRSRGWSTPPVVGETIQQRTKLSFHDCQMRAHDGISLNIRRRTYAGGTSNGELPAWIGIRPDSMSASSSTFKSQGMADPLRGISPIATDPAHLFPTYASGNTATNAADSLTLHNVLQDPMMSALSPNLNAYIADIVSRQVRQQERKMM